MRAFDPGAERKKDAFKAFRRKGKRRNLVQGSCGESQHSFFQSDILHWFEIGVEGIALQPVIFEFLCRAQNGGAAECRPHHQFFCLHFETLSV